jgi:peptidoglycan-associated lipoprotein
MKIKTIKHLTLAILVGFTLSVGSGCSKKTVDAPGVGIDGRPIGSGTDIDYPAADGSGYTESVLSAEGTLDDTGGSLARGGSLSVNSGEMEQSDEYKRERGRSSTGLHPIYFGFDQAGIQPDMADRMANNALFLKQLPAARVVIEGNCDERGTNEYNLALGQRRALNAKEYLINLGVEGSRIRTVSYGEERPLFLGQDEFSYAQNRRSDFILE